MYVSDMGALCQDAHIQGGLFSFLTLMTSTEIMTYVIF